MSAAVECNGCGAVVKRPALKHKLQTRAVEGSIVHRDFCNDECLLRWVQGSISERAERKAREVSPGADVTPTPLVMPPRAVSA